MLLAERFSLGDLKGVIYTFQDVGDVIKKHIDTEEMAHVTVVCSGRIKAYSHDWEIEALPGQIIDFKAGEPHELVSMEPNTKTINIIKTFANNRG